MNSIQKSNPGKKRKYEKPRLERIQLDKDISIVMMSPPPDPGGSIQPLHFSNNPFKLQE